MIHFLITTLKAHGGMFFPSALALMLGWETQVNPSSLVCIRELGTLGVSPPPPHEEPSSPSVGLVLWPPPDHLLATGEDQCPTGSHQRLHLWPPDMAAAVWSYLSKLWGLPFIIIIIFFNKTFQSGSRCKIAFCPWLCWPKCAGNQIKQIPPQNRSHYVAKINSGHGPEYFFRWKHSCQQNK